MSLWFEIAICAFGVIAFVGIFNIFKILKDILNYTEAQYKQTRSLNKWFMASGLIELIKEGFTVGKRLKDRKKDEKKG